MIPLSKGYTYGSKHGILKFASLDEARKLVEDLNAAIQEQEEITHVLFDEESSEESSEEVNNEDEELGDEIIIVEIITYENVVDDDEDDENRENRQIKNEKIFDSFFNEATRIGFNWVGSHADLRIMIENLEITYDDLNKLCPEVLVIYGIGCQMISSIKTNYRRTSSQLEEFLNPKNIDTVKTYSNVFAHIIDEFTKLEMLIKTLPLPIAEEMLDNIFTFNGFDVNCPIENLLRQIMKNHGVPSTILDRM